MKRPVLTSTRPALVFIAVSYAAVRAQRRARRLRPNELAR